MSNANHLTPAQLSARWGHSPTPGTLGNWRSRGIGPSFVKVGKNVLYPIHAVVAYEEANTHDNDNNAKPKGGDQ